MSGRTERVMAGTVGFFVKPVARWRLRRNLRKARAVPVDIVDRDR